MSVCNNRKCLNLKCNWINMYIRLLKAFTGIEETIKCNIQVRIHGPIRLDS